MTLITVLAMTAMVTYAAPKISKKKVTLLTGQKITLKITGTKKKVSWSSSKRSVATVTKKGKVTARKKGKATITAKVGTKKLKCVVTVEAPKLSKSKATVKIGKRLVLKLNGTTQTVTWKTSDKTVATVTKKGVVRGIGAGTATISATVLKKKFTCTITVPEAEAAKPDETEKPADNTSEGNDSGSSTPAATDGSAKQVMPAIALSKKTVTGYFDKDGNPSAAVDAEPKEIERTAASIRFTTLPTTLNELKQYEPLLKDKTKGKFVLFGLYASVMKAYDGTLARGANQEVFDMMSYLCDSPYALSVNAPFGNVAKQQFDEAMRQNNKWTYWGNVFFSNADWTTGYKLSAPYTMELEEYVYYCPMAATASTPEYWTIADYGANYEKTDDKGNRIGNFKTVQLLKATWSENAGRWYIYANTWIELLSDASIREPSKASLW